MKFINQNRQHIPADTAFVRRKFLDIRYAPEGNWMRPDFYGPEGQWKTEEDDGVSNYPGMKFAETRSEESVGVTMAMRIQAEKKELETIHSQKAVPSSGGIRDQSDCPFPAEGETRLLDIYLPNEREGPYPVIVDIFGGGWYFGRKSSHKLEPALNLLKRGFAVASINYSMSFQGEFPVQVQEVKAAVRFLRKHAAEYDLDPDRIALLGESAGAHYASLAATSAASGELYDSRWPNHDVSDKVQAVIAVYCPADISMMKELFILEKQFRGNETILTEYGEEFSMENVLLGGISKERKWMEKLSNAETYVDKNCPPFLFLSGTKDQVVSVLQTLHFAAKIMHETSVDNVKLQMVENAHHDIHDFEEEWIYDLEAEFLRGKMF